VNPDVEAVVATVLDDCVGVSPGERMLVVTDPKKRLVAEWFVAGGRRRGTDTVMVEMSERSTHGAEPPDAVAAAMLACDVVLAPTSKSISHTEARRLASARGVRCASMPDVTEDMLVRTMRADYRVIRRRSGALARALSEGQEVRITSSGGTDLVLDIRGRTGIVDGGDLRAPGAFGNLPAGEGFVAPVEGATNGRVVFDGSIGSFGLLEKPLVVEMEAGYARSFSGPRADEIWALLESHGRDAFAVAELGIGTNEAARVTGNVLEDEKVLGTIHVALGDNHAFGGVIRVASHQDGVVRRPTLSIDSRVVVRDGELVA
jgi:leucyl aminopeptidase (aminopeptidase T)